MTTHMRVPNLDLARKVKKKVFKMLKKVCKTRWLSFDDSVTYFMKISLLY